MDAWTWLSSVYPWTTSRGASLPRARRWFQTCPQKTRRYADGCPPHAPTPKKCLHRALGDTETRPATVLSRGSLQDPCPGLSTTHARVCIWPRSALQEHHTSLPRRLPQGPLTPCSLGLDCGPQRHPRPRAWNLRLSPYVGMKFRMRGRQDCRSPLPGALVTPRGLSPQESPQHRFLQLSSSLIRGWGAFLARLQIP